jgi:hypothetical protein
MKTRRVILAGAVGLIVVAGTASGLALAAANTATSLPFTSYAAKFACGEFGKTLAASASDVPEGPVAPGYYQTAINVHNPDNSTVNFQKKAILMYSGTTPTTESGFEAPLPPGNLISTSLPSDYGMLIDCQDIRAVLLPTAPAAPTFIEGYVIIQVPNSSSSNPAGAQLDVTSLLTGNGYNCAAGTTCTREGFSASIEQVKPDTVTS